MSGIWSCILCVDDQVVLALVLIHAAPMACECLSDPFNAGMQQSPMTAFDCGNALSLRVFILSFTLLNETGLFELVFE
jgi:hypothetical protein